MYQISARTVFSRTWLMSVVSLSVAGACLLGWGDRVWAQGPSGAELDAGILDTWEWRGIGPKLGGRSIASAGSMSRPLEYYFGATGGGLWKTTDGGTT